MGNFKNEACSNGIESSLDKLVVALCDDYRRRERILREGGLPLRHICEMRYLNAKILECAEEAALSDAEIFIDDIGGRIGYVNSELNFMSESTYKRRKAEIKKSIAKRLYLLA
jgi:hypothetical protein